MQVLFEDDLTEHTLDEILQHLGEQQRSELTEAYAARASRANGIIETIDFLARNADPDATEAVIARFKTRRTRRWPACRSRMMWKRASGRTTCHRCSCGGGNHAAGAAALSRCRRRRSEDRQVHRRTRKVDAATSCGRVRGEAGCLAWRGCGAQRRRRWRTRSWITWPNCGTRLHTPSHRPWPTTSGPRGRR